MNRYVNRFVQAVILLSLLFLSTEVFAANKLVPSEWLSKNGSLLVITSVSDAGLINGYYINKQAGYACQNSKYELTGKTIGNAISFTVLWVNPTESCSSITSWVGYFDNNFIMFTNWQLVKDGAKSPTDIINGTDKFTNMNIKKK
jgi:hypothetical protein